MTLISNISMLGQALRNFQYAVGVNATPTLFINGQKIDGAVPVAEVRAALDQALRDAGEPVPQHSGSATLPLSR